MKLHMSGAKGQTKRIMTIIAAFPTVEARNVTPGDVRSNWVVTGTVAVDILQLAMALVEADEAEQVFINLAVLDGEFVVYAAGK